jgi:choline dehydrogenase-like flavoprotein
LRIDGCGVPAGTTVNTDICVIGAGPAGLALATRLAESTQLEVLVLESGKLEFDPQAPTRLRVIPTFVDPDPERDKETADLPYSLGGLRRRRVWGRCSRPGASMACRFRSASLATAPWPTCPDGGRARTPAWSGWASDPGAKPCRSQDRLVLHRGRCRRYCGPCEHVVLGSGTPTPNPCGRAGAV